MLGSPLVGTINMFDNYNKLRNIYDLLCIIINSMIIFVPMLLQLLPVCGRSFFVDPYLDIYTLEVEDHVKYLMEPMRFFKYSMINEFANELPFEKNRIIEIFKMINCKKYMYTGYYSENKNNTELPKTNINPLLIPFSLFYCCADNRKFKHDGMVQLNNIFGFGSLKMENDKHITNGVEYEIEYDKSISEFDKLKLQVRVFNIDHLSIIGFGDNIYLDKYIWCCIYDILNDT